MCLVAVVALAACSTGSGSDDDGPTTTVTDTEVAEDGTGSDPSDEDAPQDEEAATEETSEQDEDGPRVLWSLEDPDTVAGPAAEDGVALFQRVTGDEAARHLELVAVDVETGEELWSEEVSPGAIVPGIAVQPVVIDGMAVYFQASEPSDSHEASLVFADLRTSEVIARAPVRQYSTGPSSCPDERDVCVNGWDGDDIRWWRIEVSADEPEAALQERVQPDAEFSRPIGGGGLLDLRRDDDQEFLAVHEDGEVLWERSVGELFDADSSSNYGWAWQHDEDEHRLIGWLGSPWTDEGDTQWTDLAMRPLVAVERSTGELLWQERGVDPHCTGLLHVPSDEDHAALVSGDATSAPSLPVWCRRSGRMVFTPDDPDLGVERIDVHVEIEGFDPARGVARWSHELDDPIGYQDEDAHTPVPLGAGATVVVAIDGEQAMLDLGTGELSAVAEPNFWCIGNEVEFDYHLPWYFDDEPHHGRYGGSPVDVCDADGTLVELSDELPPLPNGVGIHADGVRLIRTSSGLIAIEER